VGEDSRCTEDRFVFSLKDATHVIDLAVQGLQTLKSGVTELIKSGLAYQEIKEAGSALESLKDSTKGLFSDDALSRLVKMGTEFKWTSQEIDAVSKAAVSYARYANVEFDEALKTVTDAAQKGSTRGLKP